MTNMTNMINCIQHHFVFIFEFSIPKTGEDIWGRGKRAGSEEGEDRVRSSRAGIGQGSFLPLGQGCEGFVTVSNLLTVSDGDGFGLVAVSDGLRLGLATGAEVIYTGTGVQAVSNFRFVLLPFQLFGVQF